MKPGWNVLFVIRDFEKCSALKRNLYPRGIFNCDLKSLTNRSMWTPIYFISISIRLLQSFHPRKNKFFRPYFNCKQIVNYHFNVPTHSPSLSSPLCVFENNCYFNEVFVHVYFFISLSMILGVTILRFHVESCYNMIDISVSKYICVWYYSLSRLLWCSSLLLEHGTRAEALEKSDSRHLIGQRSPIKCSLWTMMESHWLNWEHRVCRRVFRSRKVDRNYSRIGSYMKQSS